MAHAHSLKHGGHAKGILTVGVGSKVQEQLHHRLQWPRTSVHKMSTIQEQLQHCLWWPSTSMQEVSTI
eukprot:1162115-Pelagomonas_calceolata.AAC.7